MSLKNMNILVTGASKGIGTAISKYLLKEGANVILHYNSSKEQVVELSNKYKGQAVPVKADLAVESDIYALMENSIKAFDKIDTIVLNAAVYLRHASYIDTNHWFKVWKKTLSINLDAVGLLTKLGIDHFKENNGGRFVYIGSRAVFRGETQEYLAYAASKGGITSLARSVARSFGKDNIKSFVIAPGFVKTDMAEQFIRDYGKARVINELALNKLTEPKDIAPLAGLMCSGQMDHATGSTIDINAGSHIR